ncbi:Reticulocyte-binding protein 2-like protein a [Diplonema papillatum]|nr:Reticulocyte-binding protein 2-like protein a [Diplonema papillatum]
MDWQARMERMIKQAESNIDPLATLYTSPEQPPAVLHLDRRNNDLPLQHQVYEVDNRVRVCMNELSELRLHLEKNSKEAIQTHLAKVKDDLKRDFSHLEKKASDDLRVVGHELRCRIVDTEKLVGDDRRRREEVLKKVRNTEDQYSDLYEQLKESYNKTCTKVDIMEAELRCRQKDGIKGEDGRFDDIRNEVRYQAERMEETKRQIGLRMDKVADAVRIEAAGMQDVIREMVREVWKEHVAAMYSTVNHSLDNFETTLKAQSDKFKQLESAVRNNESYVEAEFSIAHDNERKRQVLQTKFERELYAVNEALESHKAQLKYMKPFPDDISRLQLDLKRVHEQLPLVEATCRKHTTSIEVMKAIPDLVEELRWEVRRMQDPVQRQEGILEDAMKRVKKAEEIAITAEDKADGALAIVKSDQDLLSKSTKRLMNAMTKISEQEEEDGRKTAVLEKLKHQIQEHQTALRTVTPQISNLSCLVDANKLQLEPRLASVETQIQEAWNQLRELQARASTASYLRDSRMPMSAQKASTIFDTQMSSDAEVRLHSDPDNSQQHAYDQRKQQQQQQQQQLLLQQQQQDRERQAERDRKAEEEREDLRRAQLQAAESRRKEEEDEARRSEATRAQQERERDLQRDAKREEAARAEQQRQDELQREQKRNEAARQQQERQARSIRESAERDARLAKEAEEARLREEEEEQRRQQQQLQQETQIQEVSDFDSPSAAAIQPGPQDTPLLDFIIADSEQGQVDGDTTSAGRRSNKGAQSLPTDRIVSFDIDSPNETPVRVPDVQAPQVADRSSGSESSPMTFTTSTATSKRSTRYSKKSTSQRSSQKSGGRDFKLEAPPLADAIVEILPSAANVPRTRPTSILAAMQSSESEMEKPVPRSRSFVITSPENTDGEAPQPGSNAGSSRQASRSSRRSARSSKSDFSLPE